MLSLQLKHIELLIGADGQAEDSEEDGGADGQAEDREEDGKETVSGRGDARGVLGPNTCRFSIDSSDNEKFCLEGLETKVSCPHDSVSSEPKYIPGNSPIKKPVSSSEKFSGTLPHSVLLSSSNNRGEQGSIFSVGNDGRTIRSVAFSEGLLIMLRKELNELISKFRLLLDLFSLSLSNSGRGGGEKTSDRSGALSANLRVSLNMKSNLRILLLFLIEVPAS